MRHSMISTGNEMGRLALVSDGGPETLGAEQAEGGLDVSLGIDTFS